ncbi:MAG TPA: pitrilysin family protein [Pyrinomonadaceae bacterium]|nr:pitrilysin family protein [Pyrinomonadaceae bacterium]
MKRSLFTVLCCVALVFVISANGALAQQFDIPYQKFVLSNGLTVIVHEDHKAPIVAVNVWYHVGSKNEKPGKTGFAHLFEHLMFNGSENSNDDYFQILERIGATDLNGTTNEDRTNYFQNVPVAALDTVLFLESDRMGHLIGAIDKAKLDEQRGVVQNEKRQGDNAPYSVAEDLIINAVFPAGHPYSHSVIGSLEDLDAASLADVKEWFKSSYGPGNAVVVIAGDIDVKTAKEKAEKYFGGIAPGPPVAHFEQWVAKRTGEQRQIAQDRVPQARIYKVWNIPGVGSADNDYLNLLSDILYSDKASRLYKRLIYDDQTATSGGASLDQREIASLFVIQMTAKPGGDINKVEAGVDQELARLLAEGPTQDELDRVKTQYFSQFVRGAERIGGFGGKSDILATNQVFRGSPDAYKESLDRVSKATVADLKAAGQRWLGDGVYSLQIVPFPKATATADVDRKTIPTPGTNAPPKFPPFERAKLANGMEVIVAERHSVPVINMELLVNAGFASDQFAQPGTAALAMNMIDEGTKTRSAIEISKELASLGAKLASGSTADTSSVRLSTLKTKLDGALGLYADVILDPAFPAADFERLKKQQIAGIQNEKVNAFPTALRVLPKFIYGAGHAYASPGTGFESTVAKITRADLVKFHDTWFKPNNATIVIVGDTTMAEIKPKLEKLFAGWKPGAVPTKNIATVKAADKPVVYLVDKPGAAQSVIIAGLAAPPESNPNEIAIASMNTVLGGAFVSRLNMNLREDKHWSYGAGSFMMPARGQRMFLAYAPVQTDKTKESVSEVKKELADILTDKPITPAELDRAKGTLTKSLPGRWETNDRVGASIGDIVQFGLAPDYFSTYADKVNGLVVTDLNNAAKEVINNNAIVWVIVGDLSKIESGVRELNLGEVHIIDADGNVLK